MMPTIPSRAKRYSLNDPYISALRLNYTGVWKIQAAKESERLNDLVLNLLANIHELSDSLPTYVILNFPLSMPAIHVVYESVHPEKLTLAAKAAARVEDLLRDSACRINVHTQDEFGFVIPMQEHEAAAYIYRFLPPADSDHG
jgi:hypothetical protein